MIKKGKESDAAYLKHPMSWLENRHRIFVDIVMVISTGLLQGIFKSRWQKYKNKTVAYLLWPRIGFILDNYFTRTIGPTVVILGSSRWKSIKPIDIIMANKAKLRKYWSQRQIYKTSTTFDSSSYVFLTITYYRQFLESEYCEKTAKYSLKHGKTSIILYR